MDPKNMTLGELVCEYIDTCCLKKINIFLCTELVTRLNLLEISIPQSALKWGIPDEMQNAIKKKADYQERLKKKTKEDKLT